MAHALEASSTTVTFETGPYASQTLRIELLELQKAKMCRKSGQHDRRTLDPPPVIQTRLFQTSRDQQGNTVETEVDYSAVFYQGLVCHVEIFDEDGQDDADANRTAELTGERFVPATVIQSPSGPPYLLFVFGNLAVKKEGTFVPKFSCYDLLSTTGGDNRPCLARIVGGAFSVYSTKRCPPLDPSTELTKAVVLTQGTVRRFLIWQCAYDWVLRQKHTDNLAETRNKRKIKQDHPGSGEESGGGEGSNKTF